MKADGHGQSRLPGDNNGHPLAASPAIRLPKPWEDEWFNPLPDDQIEKMSRRWTPGQWEEYLLSLEGNLKEKLGKKLDVKARLEIFASRGDEEFQKNAEQDLAEAHAMEAEQTHYMKPPVILEAEEKALEAVVEATDEEERRQAAVRYARMNSVRSAAYAIVVAQLPDQRRPCLANRHPWLFSGAKCPLADANFPMVQSSPMWQLFVLLSFAASEPLTLVQDPEVLARLTLPIASFFGATKGDPDNEALYKQSAAYRALVDSLAEDLTTERAADPRLDTTMAKIHRLFDIRWLRSPHSHFELIGVVNRLDRRPFRSETCGEVRLVYRLAYRTEKGLESRLPMTVNVVHWVAEDCLPAAKRWALGPNTEIASALVSPNGPLRPEALSASRLKAIEINLQSVRWPSTTRPDLGGHAEYFLRVFRQAGGGLVLDRLENTPDVVRLLANRELREKLKIWIGTHLTELDDGIAVVPAEFLARKATSVSPRGLNRLANRPFSRLFEPKDFSAFSYAGKKVVRSPKALLRRLDDLSCVGCHQGRSVAGFHLIGIDRKETLAGNAIAVTGSPHLLGDQTRRRAFVARLLEGASVDNSRPLSERALQGEGGYGSHCGLGDAGFSDWICDSGLSCRGVGLSAGDDTVGTCLPKIAQVGDPCEVGAIVPHGDSHQDRVTRPKPLDCGKGFCEVNSVGFPDGMCAVSCDSKGPSVRCGGIAILAGFNGCLGAGKPFPVCLRDHVRPAGLRACSDGEPCRDDYLCARGPEGGVCLPPYFLFQMRVDGHPKP